MSQQMVDLMEAVWRSIDGLCADLTPEQWALPTECPGWAVQDQVSHLVGSECRLLGRPAPEHEPADTSHVQNEVQSNEVLVDYRRQFSGAEVLAEFREVTAVRLGVLRAMKGGAAETPNPLGSGPYTDLLAIRIYDAWVHEQDVPGHPRITVRSAYGRSGCHSWGRKVPDAVPPWVRNNGDVGASRPQHGWRPAHGPPTRLTDGPPHHGPRAVQRPRTGRWTAEHALANGSVADGDQARIVGDELYDLMGLGSESLGSDNCNDPRSLIRRLPSRHTHVRRCLGTPSRQVTSRRGRGRYHTGHRRLGLITEIPRHSRWRSLVYPTPSLRSNTPHADQRRQRCPWNSWVAYVGRQTKVAASGRVIYPKDRGSSGFNRAQAVVAYLETGVAATARPSALGFLYFTE